MSGPTRPHPPCVLVAVILLLAGAVQALEILNSLPTGSQPAAVAVNPLTNKAYVANAGSNTVSVLDNATGAVTATLDVGTGPCAVAVDPLANRIYVANKAGNSVSIIDGATNAVTSVAVGNGPSAIAINGMTQQVYVANTDGNSISQISGSSVTRTLAVGTRPSALAVNSVTDRIYAANHGSANVSVIAGASGAVTTIAAEASPVAIAVNVSTNRVYVANSGGNSVTVIDGATGSVAQTVAGDTTPVALAVNPVTNRIYVANRESGKLTVLNGADNSKTIAYRVYNPTAIAINSATNMIYVANDTNDRITVFDGSRIGSTSYMTYRLQKPGSKSGAIAINTVTNQVFVANRGTGEVDVVDATGYVEHPGIALPAYSMDPSHNPVTNRLYFPRNEAPGGITVVNGNTDQIEETLLTPEPLPYHVGINPVTNKIYVSYTTAAKVHVIDGATKAIKEILLPEGPSSGSGFPQFTVNPVTNKIYLDGKSLWLIDGVTDSITRVADRGTPHINPATGKVYQISSFGFARIMDEKTNVHLGNSLLDANSLAINPVTNKVYLENTTTDIMVKGWVDVMDGHTDKAERIPGLTNLDRHTVQSITPNIATNKLYAIYDAWSESYFIEIDGTTNQVTQHRNLLAEAPIIGINAITNTIYYNGGFNGGFAVGAINGAAKKRVYQNSFELSGYNGTVVPANSSYYGLDDGKLFPVRDLPRMETGLGIQVDPLPNNATFLARPALTGKAVNRPSGGHTGIAGVFHQLHTTQAKWTSAAIGAGAGSDSVAWTLEWGADSLRYGLNYVCIAALDYQAATTTFIYPIYRIRELPARPGSVALTAPPDNAADVRTNALATWTAADGAAVYEIRFATDPEFTKSVRIRSDLTGPFDTLRSFQYSTTYYWKVRAYNLGGFGEWSSVRSFTTIIAPPGSPVLLQPVDHQKDVAIPATLVWRKWETADTYQVQWDTSASFNSTLRMDASATDTALMITGLAAGVKYFWRVGGVNRSGSGGWSTARDFITVPAEPAVPQLLEPPQGASDQPVWVKARWRKPDRAETYHIQVALDSAFANVHSQDSSLSDSAKTLDLKMATAYFWRVRARNGGGIGAWSAGWKLTTTDQEPPPSPALVAPLADAVDRPYPVAFSWTRVPMALTYHVQAATDSGFARVADQDSLVSDSTLHLFQLAYGTTHYWRARAKGKGGNSPWSGIRKFTTGIAPPAYPLLLSPSRNAVDLPSPLAFRWSSSRTAASYDIEVAADSAFDSLVRQDSLLPDTLVTLGGLKASTPYFWRIRGANSGGAGVWSPAWKFTTGTTVSIPKAYSISRFTQFHGSRELRYALPRPSFVSVAFYDLQGRLVASLVNRMQNAGHHALPLGKVLQTEGTLILVFKAGEFESRGRVVILK